MKQEILLGDCLEVLRGLPDNSVDSVVTDPPYGLAFMGKKWDYDVPSVEVWQEVLRVLKPGGHALVACGTRTQHRMAVNLEDAGFEIRDIVAWVYGSGFPKSLNVGKSVDKLQGNEREVVGKENIDIGMQGGSMHSGRSVQVVERDLTRGTSEWEGWGTSLKPSVELWTLCRKPLSEKNVAENCLKWGVGGINIDACRVAFGNETDSRIGKKDSQKGASGNPFSTGNNDGSISTYKESGRFPANLIHDGSPEVVGLFPETKSGKATVGTGKGFAENASGIASTGIIASCYADSGSASRFFYCAKASKSERGEGNNHPTVKPVKLMKYLITLITPKNGIVLEPFGGSGTTAVACVETGNPFIIIEREPEYIEIIKKRVSGVKKEKTLFD